MKHCPNDECPYLEETGRAGEYRDEIVRCSDCGSELVDGESPAAARPGPLRWVAVAEVPDAHAAHLARSALAMEGIPCELRPLRRDGGSLVPGQPGKAELIVPDGYAEAARETLAGRSGGPVALPDGDDLEFVDAEGMPLATTEFEDHEARREDHAEPAAGETWPDCPRCGSSGVTHLPPEDPGSSGLLRRLFGKRARWSCLACQHTW